jgi:hypothetical protein
MDGDEDRAGQLARDDLADALVVPRQQVMRLVDD